MYFFFYFYPNMKAARAVVHINGYFLDPIRKKIIYSIIYCGIF